MVTPLRSVSATDLSLDEQAALTAGIDFWHTAPVDRLGIPSLRVTDGPAGARGHRWSVGTSASLPCGSALAATWDRELVRRVGRVLGDEAQAKGAGVLLGPTVNIHRHPLNGRHFESFSEDPFLTTEMALVYIEGVQERGVGACIKHFVCNDQEHERHTINVEVDESALREIYLPPFEAAVRAGVWSMMGAYNRLRGTYCCENPELLIRLLRDEWGFDGALISDWFATHSTTAVASGLDLEMPGPALFLGPLLVDAVGRGDVADADVARAAGRVLHLMDRAASPATTRAEDPTQVARAAASEAIVLLRNTGVLPLAASGLRRVAVIGAQADRMSAQGGGSAEVSPTYVTSPLEAICSRAPDGVEIIHAPGSELPGATPPLDYRWVKTPAGEPGMLVEVFNSPDRSGEPVLRETVSRSIVRWGGSPAPGVPAGIFSARTMARFTPDRSGTWQIGLASAGEARLFFEDRLLLTSTEPDRAYRRGASEVTAELELESGRNYRLVTEFTVADPGVDLAGLRIGARPRLPADGQQRAVAAAQSADVAIVIVGYDGAWESEGEDRPHMDLPGGQDELVRAVAAVNPRTIVVLNAGAPVSMPWADEVAAVLHLWFPGMEGGNALADVLFGDVDPSGRLPTTIPYRLEDTPAYAYYPGEAGLVRYAEGRLVGYRYYDRTSVEPRFCFGHGLSYTRFAYAALRAEAQPDGRVLVSVDVTNIGQRRGREVVQLYVRDPAAAADRPDKELREFAKLDLDAGERQSVTFELEPRAFAHWDQAQAAWTVNNGDREILIGSSSRDIRQSTRLTVRM